MKHTLGITLCIVFLFATTPAVKAIGEYCCPSNRSYNENSGKCRVNYVPPGNQPPPEIDIDCVAPDSCIGISDGADPRGQCIACDPSNPSRCSSNQYCCNERDTYSSSDKKCHTVGIPGNPSHSYDPQCPSDEVCIRSGSALLGDQKNRGVCSLPPHSIICDPSDSTSCPNGQYCTANRVCEFVGLPSFDICESLKGDDEEYRACDNCTRGESGVWTALGCIHFEPQKFITDFLKIALGIAGGIALLLMIYGSFLISTSAGDPKKAEEGKEMITGTIAGLLFIIFSVFLLKLIGVDILQIPNF